MMPTGYLEQGTWRTVKEFQSLFFWTMPTGFVNKLMNLPVTGVSILVLLDDAYRLD